MDEHDLFSASRGGGRGGERGESCAAADGADGVVDFEFEGGEIFGGGGDCGEGIDIGTFRNGAVELALGGDVVIVFGNLLSFMLLSVSPCCDVFFGEETMSGIICKLILAGVTLSLEILNGHDTDFWSGWLFFFFLLFLVVVVDAISYQSKKLLEKTQPLRRLKGRNWWSTDFKSTSDIEYVPAARSVVILWSTKVCLRG